MLTDEELEQLAGDVMKVSGLVETAFIQLKDLQDKLTVLLNNKEQDDGKETLVSEPDN